MKEYFVEKPMPQFGKDIYSFIPIPNEIVADIRADAIDEIRTELIDMILGDEEFTAWQKEEIILCVKYAIEQLKEQSND